MSSDGRRERTGAEDGESDDQSDGTRCAAVNASPAVLPSRETATESDDRAVGQEIGELLSPSGWCREVR